MIDVPVPDLTGATEPEKVVRAAREWLRQELADVGLEHDGIKPVVLSRRRDDWRDGIYLEGVSGALTGRLTARAHVLVRGDYGRPDLIGVLADRVLSAYPADRVGHGRGRDRLRAVEVEIALPADPRDPLSRLMTLRSERIAACACTGSPRC